MNGYKKRGIHPDTQITILWASVLVVFVICLIGKTIVSCRNKMAVRTTELYLSTTEERSEEVIITVPTTVLETTVPETEPETTTEPPITEVETTNEVISQEFDIFEEEIRLIALTTCGEAEGESEYGKRLVIDTILNRVDCPNFPNTVSGVIYQKGQFECMWTDRLSRSYVDDDICDLVREELRDRTDDQVIFFQQGCYSPYGSPLYKVGCHYFSKYT